MRNACEYGLKAPWISGKSPEYCSIVCKESHSELLQMRSLLNLTVAFQLCNPLLCQIFLCLWKASQKRVCACISAWHLNSNPLSLQSVCLKSNKEQGDVNCHQLPTEDENICGDRFE